MTALLTENLPLLTGAPNGIKRLRELILELAVRGKLLPQNPSDEPASDLLKRIAEKKARLVAEGKIRTQKPLVESTEEDKPFALPAGWEWTRLGELGLVGSSSRVHQKDWQSSGVPFYRAREIVRLSKEGFVDNDLFISEELFEKLSSKGLGPATGDIMITGVGTIGIPYCVKENDRFYYKDASVLIFKNYALDDISYLLKYLVSPLWVTTIHKESMGTTVHTLTIARASETLCPLPPLAEQQRIAAKVDELMALCDRLDAQQADAESAHAQLVQALLDSLTQASDATDFAANWQRLAEHFHTLFTTESSIDALKQALLKLAAMGKLVPQDPSDEPARELLERIADEKVRLVAVGKIKEQTLRADSGDETKPFALPEAWEWCRVSDLISIKHGYAFSSSYFCESASQYVLTTPGNFFEAGGFRDRGDRTKYYSGPVDQEFALDAGDLIVAMTEQAAGLLGSTAVVPNDGKIYLHNQRLGKLIFDSEIVSSGYIFHYFNGAFLRSCVADSSTGMKVKHTSPGRLGAVFFPLPPLAEQHRIVAKVDQLMALCDQLKPRLTQARQLKEQLASTLVEQAVS